MRRAWMIVVVALATVCGLAPSAHAATHERDTSRTYRVEVYHQHEAGHIATSLYAIGIVGTASPGLLPDMPFVYVELVRWNMRTEEMVFAGAREVTLPEGALRIDRKLATASLSTTIRLRDMASGRRMPVRLDIAWRAWGDRVTERRTDVVWVPGVGKIEMRGTMRSLANAVATVAVTVGSTQVIDGRTHDAFVYTFRTRDTVVVHD